MKMESKSEDIRAAYVAAWNDCQNPPLDGKNPHFGNRYATLAATLGEVRKACKKHGIAYVQSLHCREDGAWVLQSVVENGTDEMPISEFPVSVGGNAQQFGSEMTYRKRQQAQADWGIVGEEDDDGEAAVQGHGTEQHAERKASPKQVNLLAKLLKDDQLANVLSYYKVNDISDLTISQASALISRFKN